MRRRFSLEVPVHPNLELVLRDWWSEGFELVHRRKPGRGDFIVPQRKLDGGNHTKSSAYKAFARALVIVGIPSKTLHATRNTFISVARSRGARKEVLETVTHNAGGETIDTYTEFDWRPLCEAVSCFDLDLDPIAKRPVFLLPNSSSSENLFAAFLVDFGRPAREGRLARVRPNPTERAREWRRMLEVGEVASRAELARRAGVSRARVTQVLRGAERTAST